MQWQLIFGILLVLILWLATITFFYLRLSSHYNKLTQGTSRENLQTILENLLAKTHLAAKDIDHLKKRCDTIEKDGSLHIQKIGLLRFNPFNDTGGDQSFILALLDGHDAGVVISGLYSRSGTRWYAKKVHRGHGVEHELSKEELKAITSAKSIV